MAVCTESSPWCQRRRDCYHPEILHFPAIGHGKYEYLSCKSTAGETKNIQWRCAALSSSEIWTLSFVQVRRIFGIHGVLLELITISFQEIYHRKITKKWCNQSRIASFFFFFKGWLWPDPVIYMYCHVFRQWNARLNHRNREQSSLEGTFGDIWFNSFPKQHQL